MRFCVWCGNVIKRRWYGKVAFENREHDECRDWYSRHEESVSHSQEGE